MAFFSQKQNTNNVVNDSSAQDSLAENLIVHNMPKQEKMGRQTAEPSSEIGKINAHSPGMVSAAPKKDFKIMGFVIIFFGILLIGLIIFLTYKYVISPTAKNDNKVIVQTPVAPVVPEKEEVVVIEEEPETEISDEASDISLTEPELAIEDENATSTDEVMQEEYVGIEAEELPPLVDADEDGLFDEEESILGTSVFLKDSDDDGYEDLAEIKNGYNPSGEGRLIDSTFIEEYESLNYNFKFLYPTTWRAQETGENLIVFEEADGSLIQLSVTSNYDGLSILNWYEENFPNENLSYDEIISKNGYEGVSAKDGLNIYLTDEARKNIFTFSYMPASQERLSLLNIFKLIYSSFSISL